MRRATGPARYRAGKTSGDMPMIGFLDINVGVLGIFVVILAIRLVLVLTEPGHAPHYLVSMQTVREGTDHRFRVTLYAPEGEETLESVNNRNRLKEMISGALRERARVARAPLRLRVFATPDTFDLEQRISRALDDLRRAKGEKFVPLTKELVPAASQQQIAEAVAIWREEHHGGE